MGVFILAPHLMRLQAAGYYGGDGLRREGLEGLSGEARSILLPGRLRPPTLPAPWPAGVAWHWRKGPQGWAEKPDPGIPLCALFSPPDRAVALRSLGKELAPTSTACLGTGPSGHLQQHPHHGSTMSPCLGAINTPPRVSGAPPATPTNPPGVKGQRGRQTRASVKNSGPRKAP